MGNLFQDLRYAARMLARNPGFTAVAVLALALGIGANTAIFSVIRAVLLRPLPYDDPDRLVAIWETNVQAGLLREATSLPNFNDWRDQSRSFEAVVASSNWTYTLIADGDPEQVTVCGVSQGFFSVLGVSPALGRGFLAEDHGGPSGVGPNRVAVLSSAFWERRFGRDPGVLGRRVTLGDNVYTVIGVLPGAYRHPDWQPRTKPPEMWVPADLPGRHYRREDFLSVLARVKAGVSIRQARAEMEGIGQRLAQQYPGPNGAFQVETLPLTEALLGHLQRPLWLLFASVGLLLLIACANVANLLLARSTERRKEFAVRAALGGRRTRLFRQLITESLLLSVVGGTLGVLLAVASLNSLAALGSASIPRSDQVRLNGWVFLFTFAASCLTGLVFGALPALQACRIDLNESLKATARSSAGGRGQNRLRSLLVASEVTLTLVLLIGAGLLMRSFWRVRNLDLGFQPSRVLTAEIVLPRPSALGDFTRTGNFLRELLERIESLPGAQTVGAIGTVPLSSTGPHQAELEFGIEGRPGPPPGVVQDAVISVASPGYFRAMGIALRRGRLFDARDTREAPAVALINESLARRYFPNQDPIGRRLQAGGSVQIARVVANVRQLNLTTEPKPQIYLPHAQCSWPSMTLVVRTAADPAAMAAALRHELRTMDKARPLSNIKTAGQIFSEAVAERRFSMLLLALFAALALSLAAIGLYGVIAYSVSQRTHEFGVRMALGAEPGDVLRLVLRQGLSMAFLGLAIGIAAALALTRLLGSLLYGVTATDPLTFSSVVVLLLAVALLASYLPARRAARTAPMVALKYE